MRIKRLEISGFKSFGERAKLAFGHGITIVVGPNGCGKSNIVDAIRWCMGEMSAKHLRGRAMQDVIFAGCQGKGPVGMAEVTLIFDTDGTAPALLGDVAEVAVTRRLHRDGTSEYLLNKVPVRLRDITDLFLGTGVGTRAYSIIEQGRIGFVVNSKPEERRILIEEVAGITKFKARKKAAERRMEATHTNLTRVNDIVREIERQLLDLRKAAAQAQQFRTLRSSLRELDLRRASHRWLELNSLLFACQQQWRGQQQQLEDRVHHTSSSEASLEAERLRLVEESQLLQEQAGKSGALEAEFTALCKELQQVEGGQRHSLQRYEQAQQDLVLAQQKIEQLQGQQIALVDEIAAQQSAVERSEQALPALQEDLLSTQQALAEAEEGLESIRQQSLAHHEGLAKASAKCEHFSQQQLVWDERQTALGQELTEMATGIAQLEQRSQATLAQQQQSQHQLEQLTTVEQQLQQTLQSKQEQLQQLKLAYQQQQQRYTEQRSRLSSLLAIVQRLDGYSDGVRALLDCQGNQEEQVGEQAAQQAYTPLSEQVRQEIVGLLSEVVHVPNQYEQAVEAMLGERLQYVLVRSEQTAFAAMTWLESQQIGRSGFVPLTAISPYPSPPALPEAFAARLGPSLAEHIEVQQPGLQPCLQAWLGDVWCVSSIEQAKAWRAEGFHHGWLVTEQGHICDPLGIWIGGAERGAGLLATRREIRQLEQGTADLAEQVGSLEAELNLTEAACTELRSHLAANQTTYQEQHVLLQGCGKELQGLSERLAQEQQRQQRLLLEQQALTIEQDNLTAQYQQALQAVQDADHHKETFADLLESYQEQRFGLQQQLRAKQEEVTTLRVQLAACQEKLTAALASQQTLQRSEQEQHQRIGQCQQLLSNVEGEQARLQERIEQVRQAIADKEQHVTEHRTAYAAAKEVYEAASLALQAQAQQLKTSRGDTDLIRERMADLGRRQERYQLAVEQLVQQVLERQDVDLTLLLSDYHMLPRLTASEEKERASLEKQLKAMGSVNLLAIDECARLEERYGFLVQQRDDLAGALATLQQAISKINLASKERFQAAFDAVNQMFQQVYPRLFRGGVARLELIQGEDLLEAGVEIVAMPPGKKLQSVSLLSGGEKALTATALVFAIFLIKPSPFCVLDEVDAPLDEANVGRFNELLREIAKVSQFIVITHNKQTMVQGDRLYGITMPQPGLSKVVAVDLQEAQETVAA